MGDDRGRLAGDRSDRRRARGRQSVGETLKPTHVVAWSGARYTMCGLRLRDRAALPYLLLAFLPATRAEHAKAGRTFVVCETCERLAATPPPRPDR